MILQTKMNFLTLPRKHETIYRVFLSFEKQSSLLNLSKAKAITSIALHYLPVEVFRN